MNPFTRILFDLDGTLVDPADSIASTIRFVLDQLNVACPFDGALRWYVGPPLTGIFARLLPRGSGGAMIERAVSLYIGRFATHGAPESAVYPGIADMLAELSVNRRLFLVTSKNSAIAEEMLAEHSLRDHFDIVIGTERDGRFANKADAVRFILKEARLNPDATAIVGDRKHDVIAGKRNGIFTIGVSYGYGTRHELMGAGADLICDTPRELLELFRK